MKPLKDWTLGEVRENCKKCYFRECSENYGKKADCPFYDTERICKVIKEPWKWELDRPTQEETIIWHPFPENMNFPKGKYPFDTVLVTMDEDAVTELPIQFLRENYGTVQFRVKAWAEKPKPYSVPNAHWKK